MWLYLIIPNQEAIYFVHQYRNGDSGKEGEIFYYGDEYCSPGKNCIKQIKLADLKSKCAIEDNLAISIYWK